MDWTVTAGAKGFLFESDDAAARIRFDQGQRSRQFHRIFNGSHRQVRATRGMTIEKFAVIPPKLITKLRPAVPHVRMQPLMLVLREHINATKSRFNTFESVKSMIRNTLPNGTTGFG